MIISLTPELVASQINRTHDLCASISQDLNPYTREKQTTKYQSIQEIPRNNLSNNGFVGLLSEAYSSHRKVAIAPQDVWMLLISEIAIEVNTNPERYRTLFSDSDEKKELCVPSGSMTDMSMDVLSDALGKAVKFDPSIMFPSFTTSTDMSTEMTQALFCDMATPYYSYSMFCCGIPEIKLLGTWDDWEHLYANWQKLYAIFTPCNESLIEYFVRVDDILTEFVNTFVFNDANIDFWKNIFTQQNVGSGGDLKIDGWIVDLFRAKHSFKKIENFTTTQAIVKYKQSQTNREFAAVYGGFNYETHNDGFIQLVYSKHVFEKVPV